MAVKRVCKYGEDILRKKLPPCVYGEIKKDLPSILRDMWDTCEAVRGQGLAANQIGLPLRLAVIAVPAPDKKSAVKLVIINPEIVESGGRMMEEEGCLSLPGLFARVPRSEAVRVRALNEKGAEVEIAARGLAAKALQHEIDHLDGKLFIDRLSGIAKIKAKSEIKSRRAKWEQTDEAAGKFYRPDDE
ncbi:MAG: peptide deformylase [Elusimicrobiales bacterium]